MDKQVYSYIGVDPLVLTNDGRMILVLRGADAGAEVGKWHIPGALVRVNETLEQALKRAVKEKTNLDIQLWANSLQESFVGVYDAVDREPRYRDVALAYLCCIVGGRSRPGLRMQEVRAFTQQEVVGLDIGFDHKKIVLDAFRVFNKSYRE